MISVKLNKSNENPFYGMQKTLELFQNSGKGITSSQQLTDAYSECKTKTQREMFYSLLFSIGDITGREHNIFKGKKINSGGNSQREAFMIAVDWMKKTDRKQYLKFLNSRLFNEYNCFDTLLACRVKTQPKTNKIQKVITSYDKTDIEDLSNYIVKIIKGTSAFDKMLVAKFLTRPRTSKRAGHKTILPQTKQTAKLKSELIASISKKMNWPIQSGKRYSTFTGYYDWRKEFNQDLESVLFSTGEIRKMDQQEFINWLSKLPSGGRHRVRRRLFDQNGNIHEKWMKQAMWFRQWESFKVEKQAEQRHLEEKIRQGTADDDDISKLKQVKKEAKVTTGAVNFSQMFAEIINGTIDKIKVQPFLDKINLPYNTLVFVDDSASMAARHIYGFSARDFGAFIATICLMKNPDDSARNLVGLFSKTCRMFSSIDSEGTSPNSIINVTTKKISKPLMNPTNHFLDNLSQFKRFLAAQSTGNSTNIASIPETIHAWVNGDPAKLEILQMYPVWTLISDGNFDQLGNAAASLNDFFAQCQKYFGFKPFVIAIDVASRTSADIKTFSGIENFLLVPPNPAQIELFLTNFNDMDIMDVYTPLQSIHRSNRYELVRNNVI